MRKRLKKQFTTPRGYEIKISHEENNFNTMSTTWKFKNIKKGTAIEKTIYIKTVREKWLTITYIYIQNKFKYKLNLYSTNICTFWMCLNFPDVATMWPHCCHILPTLQKQCGHNVPTSEIMWPHLFRMVR